MEFIEKTKDFKFWNVELGFNICSLLRKSHVIHSRLRFTWIYIEFKSAKWDSSPYCSIILFVSFGNPFWFINFVMKWHSLVDKSTHQSNRNRGASQQSRLRQQPDKKSINRLFLYHYHHLLSFGSFSNGPHLQNNQK